jgi:ATP-dependent DNA helicase RecG
MSIIKLTNLFSPISRLPGLGPKRVEAFKRLGCQNIRDIIYHFPTNVIDRTFSPPLSSAPTGTIITHTVTISELLPPTSYKSKKPYIISCSNETGNIDIIYFHLSPSIIEKKYAVGERVVISGKAEWVMGNLQMVHPDIVMPMHHYQNVTGIEPVYPLTYTLTNRIVYIAIKNALNYVPILDEWIDPEIVKKYGWKSWHDSIKKAHTPKKFEDTLPNSKALERLAYDELLAQQISLQLARTQIKKPQKQPFQFSGDLVVKLKQELPFVLTGDQEKAIEDIAKDQKDFSRMFRLLQGDVGSGKTMVAFCALLNAVEAGKQSALMVPTEILARQHFKTLSVLGEKLGVKVCLLINNMKPKEKSESMLSIADGTAQLVIGTHALFQDKVKFHNLGLVVADEQHRFGVDQRLALCNKGEEVDFLMMSATPIPRTMSMVSFGDMDVSIIAEKPKNRIPIQTSIVSVAKLPDLYNSVKNMVDKGEKIYWVCPLIEESEESDLTNVNERFSELLSLLPDQVGLVHGKMKSASRELAMKDFIDGKIKVLVATTVIEVGVDVPDATVMIIENAERFGLSQLHQLRGRVGRGDKKSYCILLHRSRLSQQSYTRLKAIRDSDDGFKIAEFDLQTRGAGDVLGTRQSGLPHFRVCNLDIHSYLVLDAFTQAKEAVANDTTLAKLENQPLKTLINLFEYEKQMGYISQT